MANSIVTSAEIFILTLQSHQDCSRHAKCQEKGNSLYESLITWIKTNQEDDEYGAAITDVFSLLKTLHQKGALSNQAFYKFSEKAIIIISSSPNTVNPELKAFLNAQRLNLK